MAAKVAAPNDERPVMPTTSHPLTHPVTREPDGERETGPRGIPRLPVWQALVGAVAASTITWIVLVPLTGLDLVVRTGETRMVGGASVAVTSLVVALAALTTAAVLRRHATRPRRAFLGTSAAVLLLSLLGPLGATSTAGTLGLTLLHLVVATAVVPLVAGRLPARRR
jgi:hypothetical protein